MAQNQSTPSCDKNRSATFLDLEALDCPVCCDALTAPIFQCDNGHIACSSCCNKLRNKCPSCTLPIGAVEQWRELLKESLSHVQTSSSVALRVSLMGKNYQLMRKNVFSLYAHVLQRIASILGGEDLYSHFDIYKGGERGERNYQFVFGQSREIYFHFTEYDSVVMEENMYGLLFVVQCFIEPYGVYVIVSCIAPCAKEVGEFSCDISTVERYTMTIKFPKVKRIRRMCSETPEEDFMLVPSFVLHRRQALKLRMCISKLSQA